MKALSATVAALLISAASASTVFAMDNAQLIASAGLTPAQAEGLTLNEIAFAKLNNELSGGERSGTGISPSYLAYDRSYGSDAGQVAASTRSGPAFMGRDDAYSQLIANAGLTQQEAETLSLREIAAAKFNRDTVADDHMRF